MVRLGADVIWMDTTPEVAPFGLLPRNLRKKQAVLVSADTSAGLVETPVNPAIESFQHFDLEGKVNELGTMDARIVVKARGDSELFLRNLFRRTPPEKWKELAQAVSYASGFAGDVSEVDVDPPEATDKPFVFRYRYLRKSYLDLSSSKADRTLPFPNMGLLDAEKSKPSLREKEFDIAGPLEMAYRVKIQFPPGFAVKAPIPIKVSRDYAEYVSNYEVQGSVLTAERRLVLRARDLPGSRRADYTAFRRAVNQDDNQEMAVEVALAGGSVPSSAKADELTAAADAALERKDYPAAARLLERAVELEPGHEQAWNNLGRAYLEMRQYEKAITGFRKQLEINSFDQYAYNNLGRALEATGKKEDAVAAFRKQIEINPLDKWAHKNLGRLLVSLKRFPEAVTELEAASRITPEDIEVRMLLGAAYEGSGNKAKAQEIYATASANMHSTMERKSIYSQMLRDEVDVNQTIEAGLAMILEVSAKSEEDADLDEPRGLAAAHIVGLGWSMIGWGAFRKGELQKAERYLEAAWRLTQSSIVGDRLAQVYLKQGRKQRAIETFALAAAAPRPEAETRSRLAALTGGTGRADALIQKARGDLSLMRLVKIARVSRKTTSAEFTLIFGNGPTVEKVVFQEGDQALQSASGTLETATYPVLFPDGTTLRIYRRAILSCGSMTGCSVVLLNPEDVQPFIRPDAVIELNTKD